MFVSRDQENLAHAHQTTAAAKPLNQPVRVLQSKTPGNRVPKTPLRVALNDENKPLGLNGQKTGLKCVTNGNENILQTNRKDGKLDKKGFVTPIGPRTRAPLGIKTTNAKGQAFQTPGLAQPTKKPDETKRPPSTRKSIKSKIIAAPVERAEADLLVVEEDDVPEIEYAPPPPVELPDPPEVFEYDQSFPQFKGSNICRGFGEIYLSQPKDEHGVALSFREYEEKCARYDKEVERQIKESLDNMPDLGAELDKKVDAMIAAGPRSKEPEDSRIDTMRARRAADALSHSKVLPVAMKPTASSLQKSKKATFAVLNTRNPPGPSNPSPMRHVAAEVISKNTIGFPKARHAPSIIPSRTKQPMNNAETTSKSPVKQSEIHPARFRELYGEPPEGSDMWVRLRQHEMSMEDVVEYDVADDLYGTNFFAPEEDDGEVFQLQMPS